MFNLVMIFVLEKINNNIFNDNNFMSCSGCVYLHSKILGQRTAYPR